MALGTWWVGDPLPVLPPIPAFSLVLATKIEQVASPTRLSHEAIRMLWQKGHHAYLALLDETPVAYGWVGTQRGGVREIGLAFSIPARNRYLWDFQTLPAWRGRGIYPFFLQAILRAEEHLADRFWILYEPGNETAARAISRAGFIFVGELALTDGLVSGIELFHQGTRALAGAAFLQLRVV